MNNDNFPILIYRNWLATFTAMPPDAVGYIIKDLSCRVLTGEPMAGVPDDLKILSNKVFDEVSEEMKKYSKKKETNKRIAQEREVKKRERATNELQSYNERDTNVQRTYNERETNDARAFGISKTISISNTISNNKESMSKDIPKKKNFSLIVVNSILDSYEIVNNNPEIRDSFLEYMKMRKSIKKPIASEKALRLNLDKAIEYGGGNAAKVVQIINNAIEHSWQGIYPPKEDKTQSMFDVIANFNGGDELGEY